LPGKISGKHIGKANLCLNRRGRVYRPGRASICDILKHTLVNLRVYDLTEFAQPVAAKHCKFAAVAFMNKRIPLKIALSLVLLAFTVLRMPGLTGCANIIPPTGGLKDSLPPKMVQVSPAENALNVTGKKITFQFDEYVQIENQGDGVQISPTPASPPEVKAQLRTVTVRLRDSLEPNTTYTIDFGSAVKDVNEGNALKNYRYVFSTGPVIDSLELKGKVIVAETGRADSTLIVMLHRNHTDSAVSKEKPRYTAKLNAAGEFTFRNLPGGDFSIYALKDEGGQKRYTSPKQLFGFYDAKVNAQQKDAGIVLYAYNGEPDAAPVAPPSITGVADARLRVQAMLDGGTQDVQEDLALQFNRALKTIDTNSIILADTLNQKISGYRFVIDSGKRKISVQYKWQPGAQYRLLLAKEAVADEKGVSLLRGDTIRFRTKTEKDYGKVKIRFSKVDINKNPVLQLIQGGAVVRWFRLTGDRLDIPLCKPGEYDLRLLEDADKNGVFTTGSFFKTKRQPEKVTTLSKKLSVRADWENELDIQE
jgi:hypothetical protein